MITLAQAKLTMVDDLQKGVIDEFQKNHFLFNTMLFDPVADPIGGGSGWTYAYNRLKTQPTADFREVNTEYTPHVVEQEQVSVNLKIFGGSFTIDRVFKDQGGTVSLVKLQMGQKIKAAKALFSDTVINGDTAKNAHAFEGLDKMLAGSANEFNAGGEEINPLGPNFKAFLRQIDELLSSLDGQPSAFLCNTKMKIILNAVAREAGMYQLTKDNFGYPIDTYAGIPIIDLGAKAGTNDSVVGYTFGGSASDLYAVRLADDGVHAITRKGAPLISVYAPNFNTADEVVKGGVEMVAAVAMKSTKSAAVLRNIGV